MKNHKLKIEKPCHEDWNKMAPNQLGRHCQLCEKTVVDFTKMSSEEIKEYLLKKYNLLKMMYSLFLLWKI